jgi:hypothetical protein
VRTDYSDCPREQWLHLTADILLAWPALGR